MGKNDCSSINWAPAPATMCCAGHFTMEHSKEGAPDSDSQGSRLQEQQRAPRLPLSHIAAEWSSWDSNPGLPTGFQPHPRNRGDLSLQTWARAYPAILHYLVILFVESPNTSLLPGCSWGSFSQYVRPGWDFRHLRLDHQSRSLLKLEQSPHRRGLCLLTAQKGMKRPRCGAVLQALGLLSQKRRRVVKMREVWVCQDRPGQAGFQDLADLILPCQFLLSTGKTRLQGLPLALHLNTIYLLNLILRTRLLCTVWMPRDWLTWGIRP